MARRALLLEVDAVEDGSGRHLPRAEAELGVQRQLEGLLVVRGSGVPGNVFPALVVVAIPDLLRVAGGRIDDLQVEHRVLSGAPVGAGLLLELVANLHAVPRLHRLVNAPLLGDCDIVHELRCVGSRRPHPHEGRWVMDQLLRFGALVSLEDDGLRVIVLVSSGWAAPAAATAGALLGLRRRLEVLLGLEVCPVAVLLGRMGSATLTALAVSSRPLAVEIGLLGLL